MFITIFLPPLALSSSGYMGRNNTVSSQPVPPAPQMLFYFQLHSIHNLVISQ